VKEAKKRLKVEVVDPSFFSLPYDNAFCESLGEMHDVTLIGRPLRNGEKIGSVNYRFSAFFYAFLPEEAVKKFKYLKAMLHCLYMLCYLVRIQFVRPDIIHFQWLPIPVFDCFVVYLLKLSTKTKIVFTSHNSTAFHGSPTSRWQKIGWKLPYKVFECIQVHSQDTAKKISVNVGDKVNIFVAPHGPIKLAGCDVDSFRAERKVCFELLIFGAIKEYKGVELAIEALLILQRKDVVLRVCGNFSYSPEIIKRTEVIGLIGSGNLAIIDRYIPDKELNYYIDRSDVCLYPYHEIDSSGALSICLAKGKPVLVSNIPGLIGPLNEGEFGLVFEVGDSKSLADAISLFCDNPQFFLEKARLGRSYFDDLYSWSRAAQLVDEAYIRILN
jgi:glycosyltransferase involved in cell wall biosynthesis